MARKRTWLKMEDGSRVYVTKSEAISGDDCYASYDPVTGHIIVVNDVPEVMRRKLFHELVHKAMHGLTGRDREDIFGADLTNEEYDEREESLCSVAEQRLFDLLTRNSWLKFPAPPKQK